MMSLGFSADLGHEVLAGEHLVDEADGLAAGPDGAVSVPGLLEGHPVVLALDEVVDLIELAGMLGLDASDLHRGLVLEHPLGVAHGPEDVRGVGLLGLYQTSA